MSFPPLTPSRLRLCRLTMLPLLLAALGALPAHADDAADIARLAQSGKGEEALKRIDAILSRQPADAQMRFMKGVMLSETRPAEAIAIFSRLTQDYPKLPEPYNNLAVLHAAAGQYDKARAALDKAIRTSPAYATAFDNLGDVHARLASQAYDKALQVDPAAVGAPVPAAKLALVRSLGVPSGQAPAVAAAPLPPARPADPPPVVVAAVTPAARQPKAQAGAGSAQACRRGSAKTEPAGACGRGRSGSASGQDRSGPGRACQTGSRAGRGAAGTPGQGGQARSQGTCRAGSRRRKGVGSQCRRKLGQSLERAGRACLSCALCERFQSARRPDPQGLDGRAPGAYCRQGQDQGRHRDTRR